MKSVCTVLALMGLATAPALAQSTDGMADSSGARDDYARPNMAPNIPPYSLDSRDFIFPSGLRIIMQPDHSEPMVAITTVFDRGSTSDPQGKEGIAHFVEHLWFKSRHGELPRTWDVLSEMGCQLNASTSDDWTNYMSICPSSNLPALLRLASLRMTEPVIGVVEDEVDSEREVIRNELRMRMENGGGEALRYIYDRVYGPEHPYHRLTIGTHGSLDNIKLADIQAFTDANYRPENATIVVVGDFDPDEAASLIFGNMDPSVLHPDMTDEDIIQYPRPGVEEPDPANPGDWMYSAADPNNPNQPFPLLREPPRRVENFGLVPEPAYNREVGVFDAAVDDRAVLIGWSAPGAYRDQDILARVTANVASSIIGGNLQDDPGLLKEDGQPAVGCWASPSKENTTILCWLSISKRANGERMAEKAIDQLAVLWNPDLRPMLDREFSMAKSQMLAGTLLSMDVFAGIGQGARATDIAHHAHFTGSHQYHSDVMNEMSGLSAEQVADFAYTFLRRDRAAVSILNPIPDEERLLDNSESDYHGATRGDDLVVNAVDESLVTPEAIREEITLPDLESIQETTLSNGLRVVVMPHGEAPLVQTQLIFNGGYATDLTGQLYVDDVVTDDPRWAFNSGLEPLQFAGTWTDEDTDRYSVLGIRSPSGNVESAMWMLRERINERGVDRGGYGRWLRKRQKSLVSRWKRDSYWQSAIVDEHFGNEHPVFHNMTWEDTVRWGEWKKPDLVAFHNRRWQPSNATLLVVGNIDPAEVIEDAERYFGGWYAPAGTSSEPLPTPEVAPILENGPRVVLFNEKKKTQTQVDLACRLDEVQTIDRPVLGIASTMLSDHLFEELRARAGVTYGAYAYFRTYPGGTATFHMSSLTQNSGVPLAIRTFTEVAQDAAAGEFPTERLRSTQLNSARTYVVGQQSVGQMSGRLAYAIGDGVGWDYFTHMPDALANADIEQMADPFTPCPGTQIITLVGPAEVIEPLLQEEGIEYELFDADERALALLDQYSPKNAKKFRKALAAKAEAEAEAEAAEASEDESDEDAE